jgi:O-methyltransferase
LPSTLDWIDRLAIALYRMNPAGAPYLALKRIGIANSRRRVEFYTLETLLQGLPIRGSILECGTYRGGTLLGMAHVLGKRGLKPPIFGLDSFEGFPEPDEKDKRDDGEFAPEVHRGALGDTSYAGLLERIDALGWNDHVRLIKGYFEDTLPGLADHRYSLVHIDCDLYQGYMTCLEHAYPRMLPGSVMVFDDYRVSEGVYPGADRAVDEFFQDKPEKLERLPDPRGLRTFTRIVR